jgi:hypothetical protein
MARTAKSSHPRRLALASGRHSCDNRMIYVAQNAALTRIATPVCPAFGLSFSLIAADACGISTESRSRLTFPSPIREKGNMSHAQALGRGIML